MNNLTDNDVFEKDFLRYIVEMKHILLVYEDLHDYRFIAARFIADGLKLNDCCIMATDEYTHALVLQDLAGQGINTENHLEKESLILIDVNKHYSSGGGFDPEETVVGWQNFTSSAVEKGYNNVRAVGEATFALGGNGLDDKIVYYENILNEKLFPEYPFLSLCVYNKNRYSEKVLKAAVQSHPMMVYGQKIFKQNIYYVSPDIYFSRSKNAREIDTWLANVELSNSLVQQLVQSDEKIKQTIEATNDGMWEYNVLTDEFSCSERWASMLGYSINEIPSFGCFCENNAHPDDEALFKDAFYGYLKGDRAKYELEIRLKEKNGEYKWIFSRGKIVERDNSGAPARIVGAHTDISKRKIAEKALAESEERYRDIVEGTDNLVTEVDGEGKITFVNEASMKVFGLSPEECIGLKAFDFIHEDDREKTLQYFNQWMEEKPVNATFENRQTNRVTGEVRDMLWTINFVYNDQGEVTSIKSIARDITERKCTEQKLIESERKLKDAQRLVKIGYWSWDIETGEVEWSDEVFKLFGLDPANFTPKIDSILELSPWPEDRQRDKELINRAMENQKPGEYEQRFMRPDGSIGYYLSSFQGVYDENCKLIAMRGTAQDITERKKAENELIKAHEELELRVEERTKELSDTVQMLKSRNREIELLTEAGEMLQVCSTEEEGYKILANFCKRIWPDSRGFLAIFDKSLGLNTIETYWGESIQHRDPFSPEDCWAFRRGKCHFVVDPENDLACKHILEDSINVSICIPITARGEAMGVLGMRFPIVSDIDNTQIQKRSAMIEIIAKRITEVFSLSISNIRLRQNLYEQSTRDPLTGLYNRAFMERTLGKELKIAKKGEKVVSVIMLDVDHFKKFNDDYGHETGDEVLRRLGIAICSSVRPRDTVCRYGGEEILVILPGCSLEDALDRAEAIRSNIENNVKIRYGDNYLQVTASLGVAQSNEKYFSKEELVSAADQALYSAKQSGRNIVQGARSDSV